MDSGDQLDQHGQDQHAEGPDASCHFPLGRAGSVLDDLVQRRRDEARNHQPHSLLDPDPDDAHEAGGDADAAAL